MKLQVSFKFLVRIIHFSCLYTLFLREESDMRHCIHLDSFSSSNFCLAEPLQTNEISSWNSWFQIDPFSVHWVRVHCGHVSGPTDGPILDIYTSDSHVRPIDPNHWTEFSICALGPKLSLNKLSWVCLALAFYLGYIAHSREHHYGATAHFNFAYAILDFEYIPFNLQLTRKKLFSPLWWLEKLECWSNSQYNHLWVVVTG